MLCVREGGGGGGGGGSIRGQKSCSSAYWGRKGILNRSVINNISGEACTDFTPPLRIVWRK